MKKYQIPNLLDELRSDEAYTRSDAIKKIIKGKINDEKIIVALMDIVEHDPSTAVRNFAYSALNALLNSATYDYSNPDLAKAAQQVLELHTHTEILMDTGSGQQPTKTSIEIQINPNDKSKNGAVSMLTGIEKERNQPSLILISALGWAAAWCLAWNIGWQLRFLLAKGAGSTAASIIAGAVGGLIAGGLGATIMVKQFKRSYLNINIPGTIVFVWMIALMLDWPLGYIVSYRGSSSGPVPFGPVGLLSGLIGGFLTNLFYKKSNTDLGESKTSIIIVLGCLIGFFFAGSITWGMAFKETFFILTGNSNNYIAMLIGPFLGGGVGGLLLTLTINGNIVQTLYNFRKALKNASEKSTTRNLVPNRGRDFAFGFFGWFLIGNLVIGLTGYLFYSALLGFLAIFALFTIVMIFSLFSQNRKWISIGIITALITNGIFMAMIGFANIFFFFVPLPIGIFFLMT